jgi:hypothetical protein
LRDSAAPAKFPETSQGNTGFRIRSASRARKDGYPTLVHDFAGCGHRHKLNAAGHDFNAQPGTTAQVQEIAQGLGQDESTAGVHLYGLVRVRNIAIS